MLTQENSTRNNDKEFNLVHNYHLNDFRNKQNQRRFAKQNAQQSWVRVGFQLNFQ